MRFFLACSLLTAIGCGQAPGSGAPDLGREVPDGFLQTTCTVNSDCDDGNPCTTDTCSKVQGCLHTAKNCTGAGDSCTNGYCDSTNGMCMAMPANETLPCTTSGGLPGSCTTGTCTALPMCQLAPSSLDCSSFNASTPGTTFGASAIDKYSCASGLTGAEKAYQFSSFQDRSVTVSLTNTVVDLELVVLDGSQCVATAACEGTSVGVAGKSVTFNAKANMQYLIVVDGVNGASGSFTLNVACATCKPIQALACNMTIMGDSSGALATKAISSYPCDAMAAGPEDSYSLTQTQTTTYKMKLTGLTQDLDLIVIDSFSGQCDSGFCEASSTLIGTLPEQLDFQGSGGSSYDVVVDSKGAGGPYQLEIDCPPSCLGSTTLDCSTLSDSRRNDDPISQTSVSTWGACDTMTTGPEVVYQFEPSAPGMYTFNLTGLTADLDLIVMQGTFSTCDPTNACVASSTKVGTADESVTFAATAFTVYYIAVDGKNGAVSPYTLKLKSTQCPGASCLNSSNQLSCAYLEETLRNDDPTRSRNVVDAWACDANTTGPEVVYPFTPTVNGMYTVTLDSLTANLDLIVVSNTSAFSCDSTSACVASSANLGNANETVTFPADTMHTYYIAVDGVAAAVSPYHVKLSSASCPAPLCTDGFDSLNCSNLSLTNRNDASGATSDVNAWGACDTMTTGPEFAHLFTPPKAGSYTVEMIGLHQNLDLIVQETSASAPMCSVSAACFASSTNAGIADEKVTFTTATGKDYWIIVDGKNGAISRYTLAITDGCP